MDRIAICLFGLVGGSKGKNGVGGPVEIGYAKQGFDSCLSKHYEIDYYIHTWSVEASADLQKAYQPIKMVSEQFLHYDEDYWLKKIKRRNGGRQKLRGIFSRSFLKNEAIAAFRAKSRWTSTRRSFELINSEKLVDYSYIISARLDLEFFNPFLIPMNLEVNELLVSHWNDASIEGVREFKNQKNYSENKKGFMDLWFVGKPKAIDDFTLLIEKFDDYAYSPHLSSYSHTIAVGLKPRYFLYRGFDYELVRRNRYKSTE